jgi:hypothetical protein
MDFTYKVLLLRSLLIRTLLLLTKKAGIQTEGERSVKVDLFIKVAMFSKKVRKVCGKNWFSA